MAVRSSDEEWSRWIDHDGGPCPCPGALVIATVEGQPGFSLDTVPFIAPHYPECWEWSNWLKPGLCEGRWGFWARVVRYRVRAYRSFRDIEALLDAPAPRELEPA